VPVRAALLTGSAGRGDADFYSDLDLLLFGQALPSEEAAEAIRTALGGTEPSRSGRTDHFFSEEFDLGGVRTELSFVTVDWAEARLEQLLATIDEFDTPSQKILAGILEGLPLRGEAFLERLRKRVAHYPEPMRGPMVERHWSFFPLWYYGEAIAARDAELWRLDMLLEAAFNLLAVLAALNRLYFTRFELKRIRALIARMALAPPDLADRLESLFELAPQPAAAELGRLVEETRALVAAELPGLGLPLRFPPETRQQPWALESR
jgi:hypothetical protein